MANANSKMGRLARRKRGIRRQIVSKADRPRLTVFRSLKHIYAQVVDDATGRTLASASSVSLKIGGANQQGAREVGKVLAERAKEASVAQVRFDRGGRLFHGRVKALADAAREAGLEF